SASRGASSRCRPALVTSSAETDSFGFGPKEREGQRSRERPPAPARHHPHPLVQRPDLEGAGSAPRIRVLRPGLQVPVRRGQDHPRLPYQRLPFLPTDLRGERRYRMTRKNQLPATIRCAIYTRKSTEVGLEQNFNSLDAQREACLAYIQSQRHEGWKCLPARYDDGGFTGGNMDRPALKRLLADIEAGKIDCVVGYKLDRLSRSLLDFARIIGIFEKHHVSFVSITQQFNSATSMGRLVLNVLLSFAQFEREIISERTRDKIAATRRKGKWSGGLPVLGYDVDPQVLRLVVNPKEAARVRAIFDLYLKHQALLPVVRELERRGWRTKIWVTRKGRKIGGRTFVKTNLHKFLTNATYAGKLRYKNELHNGEHPAIVDPAKWQKVQELLQRHRHKGSGERNES